MAEMILTIRVLATMRIQEFAIDCVPETLDIARHPSTAGYEVKVLDMQGEPRMWYASEFVGISFRKGSAEWRAMSRIRY